MVPTTGASGSRSGRTCEPSTGPPSSPAFVPPSAPSPPPAANATNPPSSKGPGDRALFYLDDGAFDLAVAAQNVDGSEALQVKPVEAATQLIVLPADDGGANGPRARRVSCQAKLERQVERDRSRRASVLSCSSDELGASHPLDVGRVDDRQGARREPGVEPLVKPSEGGIGRLLVGLVARERAAQLVRRNDRFRSEVARCEGRFARTRCADQQDKRGVGNADHETAVSERSTPAKRRSAADFSLWPARASFTARRRDSMVAS